MGYIGEYAFTDTPWYRALPDGQIYIGKTFFGYKGTIPDGTTINIKEGTKGISRYALYGSGLEAVTIPQSVTRIGEPFAYSCSNLKSIVVASGNNIYDSRNNCNAVIRKADNTLITGCTATIIPNTVTNLGSYAFYGSAFTDMVIPDKVDSIASDAYYRCTKLKSLTVGKGVRKIMGNPFYYCYNLEDIIVSSANTYFDSRNNCKGIIEKSTNALRVGTANTAIPSNVTIIGRSAFITCNGGNLLSYTIPDHIEKIENDAFEYNSNLKSITIGKSVKEIGDYAFNCSGLSAVHSLIDFPFEISNYVFYNSNIYENATLYVPIGSRASYMMTPGWNKFKNIVETDGSTPMPGEVISAQSIEGQLLYFQVTSAEDKTCELIGAATNISGKITVPSAVNGYTVTAIGNQALYNYNYKRNITEIVLPDGIKTIGKRAFYYCQDLKEINIPKGVTSIGDYAFYYCESLTSLTLPESLTSIGRYAFAYCQVISNITLTEGITTIGDDAFYQCKNLTSITLPESLTNIGEWALGFLAIESINIPQNVTSIGKGVLGGCANLNSITVADGNTRFDSRNNCNAIIDKSSRTLVAGCKTSVIPNTVETIGKWAFSNHKGLDNIAIPNSVAIIDTFAFARTAISDIVIPASVRSMAYRAFSSCDSLESVTCQSAVPVGIPDDVFIRDDDKPSLYETGTLFVPNGAKVRYSEADGWSLFKNIIEREGTQIKGDVNNDLMVNGTDLVMLGNIILEKSPETASADVNGDEKINGTDYVSLVNIILGKSTAGIMLRSAQNGASAVVYIEPFAINAGETGEMLIGLNNPDTDITLMQLDLRLPEGLSVVMNDSNFDIDMTGRTSWQSHSLNANSTNGIVRILLSSMSNTIVKGSEGSVIRLKIHANQDFNGGIIKLENILNVTPTLQEFTQDYYYYELTSGGTTGINSINSLSETTIYNLSGQRLVKPLKGLNVISGKKVIVK